MIEGRNNKKRDLRVGRKVIADGSTKDNHMNRRTTMGRAGEIVVRKSEL